MVASHSIELVLRWTINRAAQLGYLYQHLVPLRWDMHIEKHSNIMGLIKVTLEGPHDPQALAIIEEAVAYLPVEESTHYD